MSSNNSNDFKEISPSDFFYRNKDIAGFDNPTRALYTSVRELIENSLDACEQVNILPDLFIKIRKEEDNTFILRVQDNGVGVPLKEIPPAFGKVFYGSKYRICQSRGTFGVGGTMALLYGQITTNKGFRIISSTGGKNLHGLTLRIDIQSNKPIIEKQQIAENKSNWRGTIVEFSLTGNWRNSRNKILDYIRQTAVISPFADITFKDEASQNLENDSKTYRYKRITKQLPVSPKEILPHPYGVDVEIVTREVNRSTQSTLLDFLTSKFHRLGPKTARKFLQYVNFPVTFSPKDLTRKQIVELVRALKKYPNFLPPDAKCLSPIGIDNLKVGVLEILKPERVYTDQRRPSAYSGHPFIVETAIAYGGEIPHSNSFSLYRFANRIPLLFDGGSDLSKKVINEFNWRHYKIPSDAPIAIITHICSTKIPFKTVGKEFIADIPEIRKQIGLSLKENARKIKIYINKRHAEVHRLRRNALLERFLPKIAELSTQLAGESEQPNLDSFIRRD
ncbi:MAG: DNA topoisomerase VI subunit B [Candidatus Ranarchaeia archaeon]